MVFLLNEMAEAETFLGRTQQAQTMRTLALGISDAINKFLWGGDHYITQLNPDGTKRDFVDYGMCVCTAIHLCSAERLRCNTT
jgi:hypothetical protein